MILIVGPCARRPATERTTEARPRQARRGSVRHRSLYRFPGTNPFPKYRNGRDLRHSCVSFRAQTAGAAAWGAAPGPVNRLHGVGPKTAQVREQSHCGNLETERGSENDPCELCGRSAVVARTR